MDGAIGFVLGVVATMLVLLFCMSNVGYSVEYYTTTVETCKARESEVFYRKDDVFQCKDGYLFTLPEGK